MNLGARHGTLAVEARKIGRDVGWGVNKVGSGITKAASLGMGVLKRSKSGNF